MMTTNEMVSLALKDREVFDHLYELAYSGNSFKNWAARGIVEGIIDAGKVPEYKENIEG